MLIIEDVMQQADSGVASRHLPLKPVDFHILLVLAKHDLHGYGIVKEIEARTAGSIRLEPGNLYRYVRRLVEEGLVAPAERREVESSSEERRRYYGVTSLGRRVLAEDASRMRTLVAAAEARVVLPPGPYGQDVR